MRDEPNVELRRLTTRDKKVLIHIDSWTVAMEVGIR